MHSKKSFFALLLLFSTYLISQAQSDPQLNQNTNLLILKDNVTYFEALQSHSYVFVLFHKDNRPSSLFLKIFDSLAKEQFFGNSSFPQIKFATIDLVASIPLRRTENLTHFPLLRLYFRDSNKTVNYEGLKTEENVKKWLERQLKGGVEKLPYQEISTLTELERLIIRKNIVIAYFGTKHSEYYDLYIHAAEKYPYYHYITAFSIEIFDKFIKEKYPKGRIMCFNNYDQESYTLSDNLPLKKSSLKNFYEGCSHKSYFDVNFEIVEGLFKGRESFMILAGNSTVNESIRAISIYKQAKSFLAGKIILTIFDSLNNDTRILNYLDNMFQITLEDLSFLPILLLIDRETYPGKTVKYKYFGGVYTDGILTFYENWKNKTLTPFYKNMPRSYLDPNIGLIKTINNEEFDEIIVNSTKHSFLMIYSQECEACKRYKKIIKKLADRYQEITNLEFFMIDGITNDIPRIDLDFVPKFLFYKKDDKLNPVELKDYREEELFHEFLRDNLGFDWKENDKEDL